MAREFRLPAGAELHRPARTTDRPSGLPPIRCMRCGRDHYTSPAAETARCLYCGAQHRLVGGRWVRA